MAHIKSRKHPNVRQLNCSAAVALAVMAMPGAVYAQQAVQTLPEIEVHGTTESYKAETVSSPKFTQPLLNTTQTISVIKKEIVQQQGGTTLTEALRNTPGVGTFSLGENGNTNTGDAIYLRGFDTSSSIFVDGVRDLGSISRDVFNIEQIEVTKGPAGADTGRGAPTGSINLSTKQPTMKEAYSGSVAVGSGDYKRVTADLNKPLDLEGGAAFRINLLKDDSGVAGRDIVKNDRQGIAAAFAFGLKTNTRTYLNYLHIDQSNIPDGGVPTVGLPGYSSPVQAANPTATPPVVAIPARPFLNGAGRVNSSNFYGTAGDFDDVTADMLTARVEHDISADVKLQNTTRFGKTSQNYLLTGFMGSAPNLLTPNPANPSTWTLARSSQMKDQTNEIFSNQTNLTAKFDTGTVKHSLATGVELSSEKQRSIGYAGLGTIAPANLYNPNPYLVRTGYNPVGNGTNSEGRTNTASVYLFDTLELSPQWQINGGVRVDHYDTRYESSTLNVRNATLNKSGTLLNWKLGALYKPTEDSSLYAAYATSKQPPGGSNFALSSSVNSAANVNYDPQETKTAEIGAKWDLLNKKLGLTAALYRTDVKNEVEGNAIDGYFQTGQKRVQGIELGVVGEITSLWQVSAGYTTMHTEVKSGAVVNQDGTTGLAYTPKQAFTAWTTYKLPGGFTIGGGARFMDALHRPKDGAVGTPQYVESYWVYDAMATYALSKNVDLQLNIYNLADKDYVASINKSGYRYTPGIPRSARLTANIKF